MKSILEEASTIMKAIEKSWVQAGKPREFSIKILEEPVKNFIGMTTKSAKIGLFFDERLVAKKAEPRDTRKQRPEREAKSHQARPSTPAPQQQRQPSHQRPEANRKPNHETSHEAHTAKREQQVRPAEPRPRNVWTDDLTQNAQDWITQCLARMNKSHVRFSITPKQSQLIITFQDTVIDDPNKQRIFFRSSSYLLMQALRSQSKKSLRGLALLVTNS